ncbi:hypothetical protein C8J57DRAFT_1232437 [Mycena rebaudengoi]|nr:hypothetical protein C8J57DRAFT_1232437 [Mycena rebaudengoi]
MYKYGGFWWIDELNPLEFSGADRLCRKVAAKSVRETLTRQVTASGKPNIGLSEQDTMIATSRLEKAVATTSSTATLRQRPIIRKAPFAVGGVAGAAVEGGKTGERESAQQWGVELIRNCEWMSEIDKIEELDQRKLPSGMSESQRLSSIGGANLLRESGILEMPEISEINELTYRSNGMPGGKSGILSPVLDGLGRLGGQ